MKGALMPSPYTSTESEDAHHLARKLEIETLTIPINEVFNSYLEASVSPFKEPLPTLPKKTYKPGLEETILWLCPTSWMVGAYR